MTTVQSSTANKITFSEYIWAKCKSQPLIPLGIVATCAALGGATWNLRTGNRQRFNHYLRLRVIAQGATVVAMVAYGSVALTREQQQRHYIKTQKLLGDIPDDTPIPEASGRIGTPSPDAAERRPIRSYIQESEAAQADKLGDSLVGEEKDVTGGAYPLPLKDRMKASDFAKRLRRAEELTKADEEAKKA